MPSFVCHRASRLTLIALYAIATVLFAATLPTNAPFTASEREIVLPGGQIAALCHTDRDAQGSHSPDEPDHRSCCAACVIAAAPGLVASLVHEMSLPRAGRAVEAGFVVSERSTIQLLRPTSRGPPLA